MRKKLLVVDDNPELLLLLSYNLKKAGHSVGTAKDGIEALKKARSLRPDLILLDFMLPELDGLAVCETLQRDPQTSSIPIIMVTAFCSHLGRLAALAAGAQDFINKPVSMRDLLARVNQALEALPGDSHRTARPDAMKTASPIALAPVHATSG